MRLYNYGITEQSGSWNWGQFSKATLSRHPLMGRDVISSFLVLILGRNGEEAVESVYQTKQFEVSFVHFLFVHACAYRRNTFMYQA